MVCAGLLERDLKIFGGATGEARQNFGGEVAPPGTSLAPPLVLAFFRRPKKRIEKAKRDAGNKVMVSL